MRVNLRWPQRKLRLSLILSLCLAFSPFADGDPIKVDTTQCDVSATKLKNACDTALANANTTSTTQTNAITAANAGKPISAGSVALGAAGAATKSNHSDALDDCMTYYKQCPKITCPNSQNKSTDETKWRNQCAKDLQKRLTDDGGSGDLSDVLQDASLQGDATKPISPADAAVAGGTPTAGTPSTGGAQSPNGGTGTPSKGTQGGGGAQAGGAGGSGISGSTVTTGLATGAMVGLVGYTLYEKQQQQQEQQEQQQQQQQQQQLQAAIAQQQQQMITNDPSALRPDNTFNCAAADAYQWPECDTYLASSCMSYVTTGTASTAAMSSSTGAGGMVYGMNCPGFASRYCASAVTAPTIIYPVNQSNGQVSQVYQGGSGEGQGQQFCVSATAMQFCLDPTYGAQRMNGCPTCLQWRATAQSTSACTSASCLPEYSSQALASSANTCPGGDPMLTTPLNSYTAGATTTTTLSTLNTTGTTPYVPGQSSSLSGQSLMARTIASNGSGVSWSPGPASDVDGQFSKSLLTTTSEIIQKRCQTGKLNCH